MDMDQVIVVFYSIDPPFQNCNFIILQIFLYFNNHIVISIGLPREKRKRDADQDKKAKKQRFLPVTICLSSSITYFKLFYCGTLPYN